MVGRLFHLAVLALHELLGYSTVIDFLSYHACTQVCEELAEQLACSSYLLRYDSRTSCVSSSPEPVTVTLSLSVKVGNALDSGFVRGSRRMQILWLGLQDTFLGLPSQLVVQA